MIEKYQLNRYQKKFYSDLVTDTIIKEYQAETGISYAAAIRDIILQWSKNKTVTVPLIGKIKDGKIEIKEAK